MEIVLMSAGLLVLAVISSFFGADSRKFEEELNDPAAPHASI